MEFKGGRKPNDDAHKKLQDVKKLSIEQYKARMSTVKFKQNTYFAPNRGKKPESVSGKVKLTPREIEHVLKDEEMNIPGLQDDPISNQESSVESSNEKIFLAASKSPDCLGKKSKAIEEPEILTLSSDDDDVSTDDIGICHKEPVILSNMNFPPYLDCEEEDDVGSKFVTVSCRTIRIGSHKFIPTENVSFGKHSLKFTAPVISNADIQIAVHVPLECVVKILCYLEAGLTSIFVYLTPPFANHLRKQLEMLEPEGIYFDPCSADDSKKRVILFIDKIAEVLLKHFRCLYKNRISIVNMPLLEELTNDELHDILLNSAPTEINQFVKKPTMQENLCKTLLIYPPHPSKGRIAINVSDYECLASEQFLNDVIIDFYLKWLHLEKLPNIYRARTHIFSTFFYKRLTAKPKKGRRSDPHETDERLTLAQRRHARVKSWTKGIDIFEKDFILVPINERSHWFIAVICYPGMRMSELDILEKEITIPSRQSTRVRTKVHEKLALDSDWSDRDEAESDEELNGIDEFKDGKFANKEQEDNGILCIKRPCILIFDSLKGSNRSRIVSTLREYLAVEYEKKNATKRIFTKENLEGFLPRVPQQMNYSDCGVYMLQFAESFFDDPIKNYKLPIRNLENWFPQEIALAKRESISKLIQSLIRRANNPNHRHPIPGIKFQSNKKANSTETTSPTVADNKRITGKRKADEELQSTDFNPINISAVNNSTKKINLLLSSKTIASSMDMKAELDKYSVPTQISHSLELIKNSYLDSTDDSPIESDSLAVTDDFKNKSVSLAMTDDSKNESNSRILTDEDIYDDLDPTEKNKIRTSLASSTRLMPRLVKKPKIIQTESDSIIDADTNQFDYQVAR